MNRKYLNSIILIALLFVADRISKVFFFNGKNNIDFGWVALNFVKNTGASFGILKNMGILLSVISVAAAAFLIYYRKIIPFVPFCFIIAGALGNLADRIIYGFVVDFVDFKFFPVFNVADALITTGVIIWILQEFVLKRTQNSSTSSNLSR